MQAPKKAAVKKGEASALDVELTDSACLIPPAIAELSVDGFAKPKCAASPHTFSDVLWQEFGRISGLTHPSVFTAAS